MQLESDGTGSTLNINALTTLQGNANQGSYSGVQATNHGSVSDAVLATLKQANLTLDGTGTISLGQIATLSGGTVTASGGTTTLSGLTAADGSSFVVTSGASLALPALASYAGPINTTATWEATGASSLLSLSKLSTVTGDTVYYGSFILVKAVSSGDVELAKLATISGGPVELESDGTASKLNAPLLTSVTGHVGQSTFSTLQASNSGSLLLPVLATFDVGTILDQGATLSLPDLSNIDGSNVVVSGGSQLALPALTSITSGLNYTETFEATGSGSRLSLPALTKITEDTVYYGSLTQVQAIAGGDVELPKLATITGGPVHLVSDGSGSTLNVNLLASIQGNSGQGNFSTLQVTNHGTVTDAALTTLKQANLTLDGTGTVSLGQIATLSGGTVSVSGGTIALGGLTDADGSSFLVSGGASLTVAALTSYAGPINVTATWEATGTNSLLSFTNLAAITEDTGSYGSHTLIEALSAGDVELAKLATISGGPVALESDGSGSKLNAPLLTSVTGNVGQQFSSTLQASNSGSLLVPEVATFDAGTIVDQGATLSLPALGNIDGSSVLVSSGSQLSLPALLTFSGGANYTETLQATGTGSRLSLPALTKVTGDTSAYGSLLQVQAVSGGDVELPTLTTITGGPVQLESDGSASTLNINVLTSVQGNSGQEFYSGLQATNHGTVTDAALATLQKADLTLDGTGTVSLGQIATFAVATVRLTGGTATLSGLTSADQSSFLVSGGAKLTLLGARELRRRRSTARRPGRPQAPAACSRSPS